jgi:hypothetical protein
LINPYKFCFKHGVIYDGRNENEFKPFCIDKNGKRKYRKFKVYNDNYKDEIIFSVIGCDSKKYTVSHRKDIEFKIDKRWKWK